MKALVLQAASQFELTELPTPAPEPGEVLVRVRACGICGSDVHGMDGSTGRRIPPIVMGHEAAGEIAAVGRDVTGWKPGDRVTFDSTISCGACWYCQRGEVNLCDRRQVLGVSCSDYRRHGAFAEYVCVPARILYRLPDGLPFEQAALVEAVSVAVHAVARARPAPGETAVVVGAGMIGLLTIQALRAAGCRQIIAIDVTDDRLAAAQSVGASLGLKAGDAETLPQVRAHSSGRGADLAFEAVGLSSTVTQAVACLRKGGRLTLIGNVTPTIDFPLQSVVTREISVAGSCASSGEYPLCLDLISRGGIDVRALISATAPLADGPTWFARLQAREAGLMKVILLP